MRGFSGGWGGNRRSRKAKNAGGLRARALRVESLERRQLLSVVGGLENEWSDPELIPDRVSVGVWTETLVADMEAYVQTLDWPDTIATLTPENVRIGTTIPLADGGYRTRVGLPLAPRDILVDITDVLLELEGLELVLWAGEVWTLGLERSPTESPVAIAGHGKVPEWMKGDRGSSRVIPGQVLVGVRTATRVADMKAHVNTLSWPDTIDTLAPEDVWVDISRPLAEGGYRTRAALPLREGVDVWDAVEQLEELDSVLWAEPVRVVELAQFIPDDPLYDPAEPPMYHHTIMENPEAWETTLGIEPRSITGAPDAADFQTTFGEVDSADGETDLADRLSPWIYELHRDYESGVPLDEMNFPARSRVEIDGDRVYVGVSTSKEFAEVIDGVQAAGLELGFCPAPSVEGWIPVAALEDLASVDGVSRIGAGTPSPPYTPYMWDAMGSTLYA
ncbi:MAG: hypothetical protein ACYTG0_34915, partial [Planctomycetota bacterium]